MQISTPLMSVRKRAAFSLLELLVAIVVLGLLVVIVSSGMTIARSKVDEGVCMSRFRDMGALIATYVADNGGALPGPLADWRVCGWYAANTAGERGTLAGRLQPYMGTPEPTTKGRFYPDVFQCPSAMQESTGWTVKLGEAAAGITKAINTDARPSGAQAGSGYNPFGQGSDGSVNVAPVFYSQLSGDFPPAGVWAIREVAAPNFSYGTRPVPLEVQHGNRVHVLFFDWHVERWDADRFAK